ncbi:AsnC family transcriptional regulator [Mesobacillus sp. AQ2]|uniref:Lrp/AsnC family transcriptional regulator n=1 Tax=unclassified Mesobacillus TaxID=2675270 RepID=UPI00203B6976|nr:MULTISPECIES: AsnC family transcriptional regulator [unclassified Mesobacillus]MCM3123073.1 AsnC family transcriptional regulator [Mesobacillus sp. MER 33]MCM3233444.1 AsnC family transcriptional regulator [Mesobacillus sp. MER 48]WHX42492.1 AsnC family transcriptional regulator [Mesobacillus sp. AQ2]
MKYEIDEMDRGIIKHLANDGRMSFSEIAANLNVTEKTVRLRYKNLKDNGILDVVGVVNPVAIGIKAGAIILLKVQPQKIKEAIDSLKEFREIRYITLTSGPYPLLVQIAVPTQDDINETMLKINELPSIIEMNSIIQLDVYKNSYEYY